MGPTAERIAQRVAELLGEQAREQAPLLDTPAVARLLGVSEEWVREHAAELGAMRVGDGPRGALRFESTRVRAALDRRRLDRPRSHQRRRAGRPRRSSAIVPSAVPADVKDW